MYHPHYNRLSPRFLFPKTYLTNLLTDFDKHVFLFYNHSQNHLQLLCVKTSVELKLIEFSLLLSSSVKAPDKKKPPR